MLTTCQTKTEDTGGDTRHTASMVHCNPGDIYAVRTNI